MISRAVIPAGYRGVRAWPRSDYIPKPLFEIDQVPLIERNIAPLRDAGIKDTLVITGHLGALI